MELSIKNGEKGFRTDFEGVTEKKEFLLSSRDKAILESFASIFEPFEIATDLLQGENYSSIFWQSHLTWASFKTSIGLTLRVATIVVISALLQSLHNRFGHILSDPIYCL